MKILFISREYPPESGGGGIGSYVANMAAAFAARGHQVHVLSCDDRQARSDRDDDGVIVHRRAMPQIRIVGRALGIPNAITRLRIGIANAIEYRRLGIDFDVVEHPDLLAEGWVMALGRRTPMVAHLHSGIDLLRTYGGVAINRDIAISSRIERLAVESSDAVTAPSDLIVGEAKRRGWLRDRDVRMVALPVDASRWRSVAPVAHTHATIGFIGRLEHNKAPDVVVRALAILRRRISAASAVFIGNVDGSAATRSGLEWLRSLGLELDECRFTGSLAPDRVAQELSVCRVVAHPALFDNFPMATVEAMAAGRPVVLSKSCGTAGIVEDAGAGAVVPKNDPKALADALEPWLADATLASAAGERGRKAVEKLLSFERIASHREQVYREAIASFGGGRSRLAA